MRAKFVCNLKGVSGYAKLAAVYGTEGENKDFWSATPSGTLEICISNPNTVDYFELGKEYYLDFSEAN